MGLSQRLTHAVFGVCMTVWAFIMVVFGLLIAFDWPSRMDYPAQWLVLGGTLLIAAGQFVFAINASRMFPGAHPRVTGIVEVLPVVGLIAVGVGVLFFWNP